MVFRMNRFVPSLIASSATSHSEAEADRSRFAHESRLLDAALASVAAGRTVSEERFNAWVDSLGTDHELPAPKSGR